MYWSSPLRSALNTGYITGVDMCKVCTEAVCTNQLGASETKTEAQVIHDRRKWERGASETKCEAQVRALPSRVSSRSILCSSMFHVYMPMYMDIWYVTLGVPHSWGTPDSGKWFFEQETCYDLGLPIFQSHPCRFVCVCVKLLIVHLQDCSLQVVFFCTVPWSTSLLTAWRIDIDDIGNIYIYRNISINSHIVNKFAPLKHPTLWPSLKSKATKQINPLQKVFGLETLGERYFSKRRFSEKELIEKNKTITKSDKLELLKGSIPFTTSS